MDPPRTKRQKVNVACDPCRARKIKCDGIQPVCEPCKKKNASSATCTWKSGVDRMSAQYLTSSAQWANARQRSQTDPSLSSPDQCQPDVAFQGRSDVPVGSRSSNLESNRPLFHSPNISQSSVSPFNHRAAGLVEDGDTRINQRDSARGPEEVRSSEHSVHAIIGATLDEDSSEGYFGTSSAGTFMQSVKKLVYQKVHGISAQASSTPPIHTRTPPASGHHFVQPQPVEYVLPSRRRADILMSCYWSYVHVLYPYLDKQQTENDYEKLWKADGSIIDERSFMCLINVIFALSSQIDESTPIEERQRSARVFYLRARELLDIVETGSVRSVQSLLVLGLYYQSTSEPHPCWIFTGLAVRTAQSLGLHLAVTSECAADARTRELFRKVWHGCILMDRVVSMTYGRPCMIGPKAAQAVPLPLPIDEENLITGAHSHSAQTQQTFSVEFYVLTLKLYDIMHDIIFNFYSVNTRASPAESKYSGFLDQGENSVFEIDRRLSRWANSLPDRFRRSTDEKPRRNIAEATLYRQAVILHQRKLHIRLLLLRPVLSTFITSEFHDGDRDVPLDSLLYQRVHLQCAIVCVKVALEAIDTIHKEKGTSIGDNNFCAAWWYNVLYLYTSATVLIAARLAPAILTDVSEESVVAAWQTAMEILEEYSVIGASIKRLITTLRLLLEAVPQQYSRLRENARNGQGQLSSIAQPQLQAATQMPTWRTPNAMASLQMPQDGLNGDFQDIGDSLSNDLLLDFDTVFDPNDLSWLMTIPSDT